MEKFHEMQFEKMRNEEHVEQEGVAIECDEKEQRKDNTGCELPPDVAVR